MSIFKYLKQAGKKIILVMASVGWITGVTSVQAMPLFPIQSHDALSLIFYGDNGTYNASTDLFHISLGGAKGYTGANPSPLSEAFSGRLVLDAVIDGAGHLSSSSVAWYGGNAALGIPDDTPLIIGEITAFNFAYNLIYEGAPGFQFIIEGLYAPQLGINPQKDIGLTLYHIPTNLGPDTLGLDIFKNDFTTRAYTHEVLVTVAEPSSLAILGLGVLTLVWSTRRHITSV